MTDNKRLNYQHLYYFWSVARAGSITKACTKLGLSQPTISSQLSVFEDNIGDKLFMRDGRRLKLTEKGKLIFNHADEIFTIGNSLINTLNNVIIERKNKMSIGAEFSLSGLLASSLFEPVIPRLEISWINFQRDNQSSLLSQLYNHSIEYLLVEKPIMPNSRFRIHINYSTSMTVAVYGNSDFMGINKQGLIDILCNSPLILPSTDTGLRTSLDKWFVENNITPRIVAEIDDESISLKLAQNGLGLVFAPEPLASEIYNHYKLKSFGTLDSVPYNFYIISLSKKISNVIMHQIVDNLKTRFK